MDTLSGSRIACCPTSTGRNSIFSALKNSGKMRSMFKASFEFCLSKHSNSVEVFS